MMSIEKTLYTKHRQAGVSLIELMISIALGLLLLGAATAMTVSSMVMNADTLKSARLNQDLDSVLQIMVNDIRRAGYAGGAPGFFTIDNEDLYIKPDNSCVLYAYDADENGTLDDTDKFGFKRVVVELGPPIIYEIQMRTSCGAEDSCADDCGDDVIGGVNVEAGTWVVLTDPDVISITGLTFDSGNSKCLNIKNDPLKDNHFWVKTEDELTWRFPCADATDENLTNYVQTGGSFVLDVGTFEGPLDDSGDRLIEVQQVNIVLLGELENDPTMVKEQVVAINVRNNRVTTK